MVFVQRVTRLFDERQSKVQAPCRTWALGSQFSSSFGVRIDGLAAGLERRWPHGFDDVFCRSAHHPIGNMVCADGLSPGTVVPMFGWRAACVSHRFFQALAGHALVAVQPGVGKFETRQRAVRLHREPLDKRGLIGE